jgi:hypothetical protein
VSKFVYDVDIPSAILVELKRYLEPSGWLIPSWCQKMLIGWCADSDDGGAAINITVNYEYRWARITFFPAFHVQGDKREAVIHELIHAFAGILANYARDTIKLLIPEDEAPKFRQHCLDELQMRHEAFVQDMAHCIANKVTG